MNNIDFWKDFHSVMDCMGVSGELLMKASKLRDKRNILTHFNIIWLIGMNGK